MRGIRSISRGLAAVGMIAAAVAFGSARAEAQKATGPAVQDWAQWRGPNRDGHSAERGWLASWPKLKMSPAWERQLGPGYSAVSVVGDRVFTMGYLDGKDAVYCLDAKKGKALWAYGYPAKTYTNMNEGGPSATPSVVDGRVYSMSRDGQAHCLDAKKGKVLWKRDLVKDFGAQIPTWGLSGSPLVREGRVYLDVGVIVALDAKTGKEVWKTKRYGTGYSSPVAFEREGTAYLAVFPADGLVILTEKDGREVAVHPWKTNYDVNAATPVVIDANRFFISSGYGTGGALVRFDGKSLTEVWSTKKLRSQMATPVYWEGHLYGFDDTQLTCLDAATGDVRWRERGVGKGALMMSQGKLIVMGGRGELMIADASHEGFKPVYKRKTLTGGDAWTMPVLSHGRVYCRDPRGRLICLKIAGARSR